MVRLILFDVDGTLIFSGGSGGRALSRALIERYGLANTDGVRYDGKTDPQIVREILALHGSPDDLSEEALESLLSRYLQFLKEELAAAHNFTVLPGVWDLISALRRNPAFVVGLATGNIQKGAQLKLERAGLHSLFSFGGFGSDSPNRTGVIQRAIERGRRVSAAEIEKVFVVGDTPRDILHGKDAGTLTVAVATGNYSLDDLKAHQPDLALDCLHPIEPVMEFLGS